jgi:acyl-lipid omega-6 desaturase (Delta-12 desaturase)
MTKPNLPSMKELNPLLAPYQKPAWKPAIWQLIDTVLPFLACLGLMAFTRIAFPAAYWLTLLLAIPTGGFMIRTFILFHDCGHNSFTPSLKANRIIGFFLGIIVFTPADQWWKSHAIHHATSSNLDKRGVGDVTTLTVEEFKSKSWIDKVGYALFRFPFIMFGIGPLFMFLVTHRLAVPRFSRRETMSVVWTNVGLAVYLVILSLLFGSFWNVMLVYLPVLWVAGMVGIWLFYIQHQFEGVYWSRDEEWDYVASALKGASYYQLPPVLQYFTGNIGFHHIHHLSPRIPNYRLEECYNSNPVFQQEVRSMGIFEAVRMVRLQLVDEAHNNTMVTFQDILG